MRKTNKILPMILAGLICVSGFAACGGDPIGGGGGDDGTVTKVKVMNFDGGVGDEWILQAAERFNEKYADYSFGNGKSGVKVEVKNDSRNGSSVLKEIKTDKKFQVYFTEQVYYNDFLTAGVLADLTDVVTEDLTAYDEEKSIEDKMNANLKNYLCSNEKYYAVPFYEAYSGIMYDVDLFEQKGFYFLTDGTFAEPKKFVDGVYTGTGKLSNGPDGKTGVIDGVDYSLDDGLPATYDDFFKLCYYMQHDNGVVPLIWPGNYQDYMNELALQFMADYEGYDRMLLNYTFNGVDDSLVSSIGANKSVSFAPATQITEENKEVLTKQAGRFYAIDFISRIMEKVGTYTVDNVMSPSMSHYDCNDLFLSGRFSASATNPTIAMMAEGTWWQNEAKETFEDMEATYGDAAAKENRRIGMMPFPKATADKVGESTTVVAMKSAFGFVNGNIKDADVLKAAKMFVQFCCTDESLAKFQQIAGMPWALNYSMSADQLKDCSYYSRTLYSIHNAEKAVVYPYSTCDSYVKNASKLMNNKSFWNTKVDDKDYGIITDAFYNNSALTSISYFNGLQPIVYV